MCKFVESPRPKENGPRSASQPEDEKSESTLDEMYEEYLEEVHVRKKDEARATAALIDDLMKEYDEKL